MRIVRVFMLLAAAAAVAAVAMTAAASAGARLAGARPAPATDAAATASASRAHAGPSALSAAAGDLEATHAYIEAVYSLGQAGVALIAPVEHTITRYIRSLRQQCPGAGSGGPQNEASQPMSYVAAVALWTIEFGSAAQPIRQFARATRSLRWSSTAITRAARRYAQDLSTLSSLPAPPLCAEVRSWKQSGFQVVPTAVLDLVRRVEGIEPEPVPPHLLAPFERGGDAALLARAEADERRIGEQEFEVGQRDWFDVMETLGLNQ